MEKEIIGYRCIDNSGCENQFTLNIIYPLRKDKTINDELAFIDDLGEPNGCFCNNNKRFEPVYKEDNIEPNPTLTPYLPYNLGIDFEKLKESKSHLIKLLALEGSLENNYILELIDTIQDYAVDNHNISRNQVFNIEEEIGL